MRTRLRTGTAAIALATATAALALGTGGAADAEALKSATGCNNNVCIYVAGNAGGTVLVQAWARNTNFTGYFHVTWPGGSRDSGTQTWLGGKGNYYSTSFTSGSGSVCATGYTTSGAAQGTPCLRVS
ncbi:hypothetical protein ABZ733_16130 [Streptomyces longwoodensis]|uniref:hypothetical protein n=1 Tax=Streptomyces longwoodensis TaxID=68231 RepID=UPI0033DC59C2